MTPDENNMPGELVARDRWTNWSPEVLSFTNQEKQPFYGPRQELSYTSPEGSGPFVDALGHSTRHDNRGIGYVFLEDDEYVPIDLDGCLKGNGDLKEWCPRPPWLTEDAWAEVSSSGDGVHTAVKGVSLPYWWSDQDFKDRDHVGVECNDGNRFIALTGDLWKNHGMTIPEVDEETFYGWLEDVCRAVSGTIPWEREPPEPSSDAAETDVDLGVYDVISRPQHPRGKKVSHPFHGSSTGVNFQVDNDGEPTWKCWRHDTTGNAHHLLGMEAGVFKCGDWDTRKITSQEWTEVYDYGRQRGYDGIPPKKPDRNRYEEYMQERAEEYDRWMAEYYEAQYEAIEDEIVEDGDTEPETPRVDPRETTSQPGRTARTDGGQIDTLPKPTRHGFEVHNGGYGVWVSDEAGDTWEEWTSFQIELNATVRSEDDEEIRWDLTIHPAGREEPFDVQVEPAVFNSNRSFKRNVCIGESTYFDGTDSNLNTLRTFVSQQDRVDRVGVNHMGYHDGVWVTPNGTMDSGGWIDDPETVLLNKDIEAQRKWNLDPDEDGDEYDEDEVAGILELLPKTRDPERFLSLLGWFYSTPIRPLIMDWEGEFNYCCVTGRSGAGKSTTISMMWEMFGMEGEPLSITDTDFVRLVSMASSNAVPMFFDEHKPSDIPQNDLRDFYTKLRKTTRGGVGQRGNEDLETEGYNLQSPILVAGEESVRGSAEERRGIFTDLSKRTTDVGSNTHINHLRLAGGTANHDSQRWSFDGYDLSQHALAYIQWVLSQDTEEFRELWDESGQYAADLVARAEAGHIGDLMVQGLQTVKFGCELYRRFADDMGADRDVITDDEIEDAMMYALTEGRGGVNRKSHVDDFFEVASRAAHEGRLEEDKHYTFV